MRVNFGAFWGRKMRARDYLFDQSARPGSFGLALTLLNYFTSQDGRHRFGVRSDQCAANPGRSAGVDDQLWRLPLRGVVSVGDSLKLQPRHCT